MAPDAQLFAVT